MQTTRHLPTDRPRAYHDPETSRYVPCINDADTGELIWEAEAVSYWKEQPAVEHAERQAFRRFLAANPYWLDDDETP